MARNPQIAKHAANRIERWAMLISEFRYEIVHIVGDENIWADLLSRWGSATPTPSDFPKLADLLRAPVAPPSDTNDFDANNQNST